MAEQYYSLVTDKGDAAIMTAAAIGRTKTFTHLAVGDSGGAYYEPTKSQTALRGEKWRGTAVVELDAGNPRRVIVTASIPSNVGGFQVREAGVFDADSVMMVVSKQPLSDKVVLSSGAGKDMTIRIYVEIKDGNAGAVTITVDPSAQTITRTEFAVHTGDLGLHTTGEKQAATAAHLVNNTVHISATERAGWNAKVDKSTAVTTTLTAAGWTGASPPYAQTLYIAGVTPTNMVEVLRPLPLSEAVKEAWDAAGMADGGQAAGAVVVHAWGDKPAINLPCRVIVRRDL